MEKMNKTIPIRCKGNRYLFHNKLKHFQGNLKEMRKEDAQKLRSLILKHGWIAPVFVWNKNYILDGHGRMLVLGELLKEGYTIDALPVVDIEANTKKEAGEILLAINSHFQKITDEGLYQFLHEMEIDIESLKDFNLPDIDINNFEASYFGETDPQDAEPQIDRAEELNKIWKVKTGDLWLIGEHRLLCGDSTKTEDVGRVMDGAEPILMVTDPPYGVEYDPDWRNRADRANGKPYGARAIGQVTNDDRVDWTSAYLLFTGDIVYVWHCGRSAKEVSQNIEDAGFDIISQCIWAKNNFAISRGDYHYKHEPCWYAVRKGKNHNWQGSRSETSLWEIDKPLKSETGHSTQKPIECMARPIRNNSAEGGTIYDPFLGSGTTMVACQNLNRKCRGIEIFPAYCAVILQRMIDAFPGIEIKKSEHKNKTKIWKQ